MLALKLAAAKPWAAPLKLPSTSRQARTQEMAAEKFKYLKLLVPDPYDCILAKLERGNVLPSAQRALSPNVVKCERVWILADNTLLGAVGFAMLRGEGRGARPHRGNS